MPPSGADAVACQLWIGCSPLGVSGSRQLQTPSSRPARPAGSSAAAPPVAITPARASAADIASKWPPRGIIGSSSLTAHRRHQSKNRGEKIPERGSDHNLLSPPGVDSTLRLGLAARVGEAGEEAEA